MTINVGLGTGSKAQQFAQTMAIGNVQKEIVAAGKTNLVGDKELYNTASELTRIMGHKNPDQFFKDPTAIDPKTGQLANPPPPPQADPKLAIEQSKAQLAQQTAEHKAQLEQQKRESDAVHQQVKAQAEIELAKIKADLDAKLKIIDAHIKVVTAEQSHRHAQEAHHASLAETALDMHHAHGKHRADIAGTALDMLATAHAHDAAMERQAAETEAGAPDGG
jgi:hypothetical protein